LSREWDRGFGEAFTELICGDPELVREFDALIGAGFDEPPVPLAPPASSAAQPASAHPQPDSSPTPAGRVAGAPAEYDRQQATIAARTASPSWARRGGRGAATRPLYRAGLAAPGTLVGLAMVLPGISRS